jgi:hypothetical protein
MNGPIDSRDDSRPDLPPDHERDGDRRLRAMLAQTYDPVLDEPVPERLSALFDAHAARAANATAPAVAPEAAPSPSPSAAAPAGFPNLPAAPVDLDAERRRRRGGWMAWGGMAAGLALGVLIGAKGLAPGGDLERAADGAWVARGSLARALDEQVSGATVTPGATRVGMSFLSRDGRYCRAFLVDASASSTGSAGLACRGGDAWRVRQIVAMAPRSPSAAASGAFRTAASPWPEALLDDIDDLRDGDTLSPDAERVAISRGWSR